MRILWIGLAGGAGTVVRYLLDGMVQRRIGILFPWGTMVVNLVGSFLITVVMHVGLKTEILSPTTRIVIATGVLGGFTTYSTFNYETLRLIHDGAWLAAALNVVGTVGGCLVAGAAGWTCARLIVGA
jgi:CrcB protein